MLEPHALTLYPQTGTADFSLFHLACISESDFDFRSSDYPGPFLLGSCLLRYLGTFCHCKRTDFSNVHPLLLGDSFTSAALIICRPSQARKTNHWFPSQFYIITPGYQHDGAGSHKSGSILAEWFSKLENHAYIIHTYIHIHTHAHTGIHFFVVGK